MDNLSFGRNITRQYDLKGALYARFNSAGNTAGNVLLDQNFVNDMNISPLYIGTRSKRNLQQAVWDDCRFLNADGLIKDDTQFLRVAMEHERESCHAPESPSGNGRHPYRLRKNHLDHADSIA